MIPIGRELVMYPVKSMAGIAAESADLGWHGLAGDRRFAFRRMGDSSGFPWLTASRLPARRASRIDATQMLRAE